MQDYRDITKLLKRQSVAPRDSGFIFPGDAVCAAQQHAAAGDGAAGCYHNVTVQRAGDLIIILYIFALFRFSSPCPVWIPAARSPVSVPAVS